MEKKSTKLLVIVITTAAIIAMATTSLLNIQSVHAQTPTLGEPFFVEKGKVSGQKEIGPNRTEFTFTGNGTMNGNIEVTNTGKLVQGLRPPHRPPGADQHLVQRAGRADRVLAA